MSAVLSAVKSIYEFIQRTIKERTDNCDFTHGYRLCVLASGSLITDIFSCFTLIIVSCLHLGQNSGKFSSTVSSRILTRVLLPQTGHNIHSYLHTLPSLYLVFCLTTIILISANIKLLSVYKPALRMHTQRLEYLDTMRAQSKYHCRQAASQVARGWHPLSK